MPRDDTRKQLKLLGVAVTELEDAVETGAAPERIVEAEAEARRRLQEIARLIEHLRGASPRSGAISP